MGRTDEASIWSSRARRLTGVPGGILLLALLHNPVQVHSTPLPESYSVTLAWDGSPSSEVIGYRVHYGAASGNYTNSIVVGNVTTNTVSGLTAGVPYFFAVTAIDAAGLESDFSNEISFVPGLPTVLVRAITNRQAVLTVKGLIGRRYDIQATQTSAGWTVIGTVTLGPGGSLDFTDTNAASFPQRFYRTQQMP